MGTDFTLAEGFINKHPFPAARVLEGLEAENVVEFIQELPHEKCLQLLNLMNINKVAKCFVLLPSKLATQLTESSNISFSESLCRQLDEPFREKLLSSLSPDLSAVLRRKLVQVANTVGVFMVPAVVVNKEMTAKDALAIMKSNSGDLSSYLYIVDVQGTFEGIVKLEQILITEPNTALGELIIADIPRYFFDTPMKDVLDNKVWYDYRFVPVIDKSGKLLGALPFKATQQNSVKKNGQLTKEILDTGGALGELYLIGLTGFLQSGGK